MQQEQLDEAEAASQIMQGDKRRAANYHYYTNKIWGLAKNFHVSFDTELGMDFVADSIIRTFEVWKK
jgi:hypothetical protein